MRTITASVAALLVMVPADGVARMGVPVNRPTGGLIVDVEPDEAASLIRNLEAAQTQLSNGKFANIRILSGSSAGSKMLKVSPYDAFLSIQFKKYWNLRRLDSDNPRYRRYKLYYRSPTPSGMPYWEIEVGVLADRTIERVEMVSQIPAPF